MITAVPFLPESVGVLAPYVEAGLFGPAEIQLAAAVARLAPGVHHHVLLATAVAARAPRLGHVGIELAAVGHRMLDRHQEDVVDVTWPDLTGWGEVLARSAAVAGPGDAAAEPLRPLVWDGTRIYLQRYWEYERAVAEDLQVRGAGDPARSSADLAVQATLLDGLFPPDPGEEVDLQRVAAEAALTSRLSVIAGGPGTGKTRTVARLLAAALVEARREGRALEVALTAPTGKAAARMTEAVRAAVAEMGAEIPAEVARDLLAHEATTIHRLLGSRPGGRFRHDALDPLTHDLVVVDETSMVSLPLMARLLGAVRPDARLVLVGDPNQLASVEAGTVLGDVVGTGSGSGPLDGRVTVLQRSRRFSARSGIAELATAIRSGDAETTIHLLSGDRADLAWVEPDAGARRTALDAEVTAAAVDVVRAALAGDAAAGLAAAGRVKVLTATRQGPNGLHHWSTGIERAVRAAVPELQPGRSWYVGRPILVTSNDPLNRVWNGDSGLTVVRDGGALAVAFPEGAAVRYLPASRLREVETWWAMTIHKSQGSEFPHVVVALPGETSPILTRELLYTGVTRGQDRITVVGSEAAIRAAVERPVARASGLRDRLWAG